MEKRERRETEMGTGREQIGQVDDSGDNLQLAGNNFAIISRPKGG